MKSSAEKPVKQSKCKVCRSLFVKRSMTHVCCCGECAAQFAAKKRLESVKRQERDISKMVREKKEALQPLSYWLKKAQTAVNKYVRLRDYHDGCISCSKPATWDGQWHAGHFRSVGSNTYLRFNLFNINKQCSQCNNHLSGNIAKYRPSLESKIGKDRLEFLETSTNTRRYTRGYLERMAVIFNKKSRRAEKRLGLS